MHIEGCGWVQSVAPCVPGVNYVVTPQVASNHNPSGAAGSPAARATSTGWWAPTPATR